MSSSNDQIFVIGGTTNLSQPVNAIPSSADAARRRIKKNGRQPVVDVIVVLVALPSLTILALLLEANTRGNWLESSKSRFIVMGCGFALAAVCLALCMYITSRLGGKMWAGAIPSDSLGPHYSYYNSRLTINEMNDLPPSYDVVMDFEMPPPAYHTIVVEQSVKDTTFVDTSTCLKLIPIHHM